MLPACKLLLNEKGKMAGSGRGMGQAGTVIFHHSKQAGCGKSTLSIRGMQAVLARTSRWLVGETGRVHGHVSFGLALPTPFWGPMASPLHELPTRNPQEGHDGSGECIRPELALFPTLSGS